MSHRSRAFDVIRREAAARMRVLARHSHDENGHEHHPAGSSPRGDLEEALLGIPAPPEHEEPASPTWALSPPFRPQRVQTSLPPSVSVSPSPRPQQQPQQQQQQQREQPRTDSPFDSARSPRASHLQAIHDTYGVLRRERAAKRPPTPAGDAPLGAPRGARTPVNNPMHSRPLTPVPSQVAWYKRDIVAFGDMVTSSYFNLLLVCIPLGAAAWAYGWGPVPVFTLNFLALIPLALLLGDVTEDLALRFGDVVGGLLNATFGNVVEMILSIAALSKGLYTVVATSLLGSILSNLLLVLGCCFFFGGLRYQTQTFNATANQATSSLLFLSCLGIMVPTASMQLAPDGGATEANILEISRGTAIVLLVIYACYLVFQLHSHNDLFNSEDDGEEPTLTLVSSVAAMAVITAAVAFASELLTGALEGFTLKTGLSQAFVGMIILPIAGNACEHAVAVMVAIKNKMDLAMGVAIGSSIQIAIFAIPFAVVVGWAMGRPFTLDFDPFATLALVVSVLHANFVTAGASSHWLMGVELLATYTLIAMTFLFR